MGTHEAGALHTPGYGAVATVPSWLREPENASELEPKLWASTVSRSQAGDLQVGGLSVNQLAEQFGTPAYILDETDFRARATAFRDAFAEAFAPEQGLNGAEVFYAGKAFLSTASARWLVEDGLNLDVCSAGELAVALRAQMPADRLALHGNNKPEAELEMAVTAGVGRIVVDSLPEIDLLASVCARLGKRARVLLRVTVGVEAHTHEYMATAHEDQKFGLSLAGGHALEAARKAHAHPELELVGLHSHIGSQIFDTSGFEVSAHRLLGLHAQVQAELGVSLPELDLGGGYGIAYTSEHDPLHPQDLAQQLAAIVAQECQRLGITAPRIAIEPGRAIAGPAGFTLYTVGTIKDVPLGHDAVRRYVSVDGGMSDNIRTALYDADYSCALASRASAEPGILSRVVGRHCESGDIVVKDEFLPADLRAGDLIAVPGTGAYCRSMASQYNHVPRPPVVAVRDGQARTIVRRETIEDLLSLDVG